MTILGAVTRTHAHFIAALCFGAQIPLHTNLTRENIGDMAAKRIQSNKGQRNEVSETSE